MASSDGIVVTANAVSVGTVALPTFSQTKMVHFNYGDVVCLLGYPVDNADVRGSMQVEAKRIGTYNMRAIKGGYI